MVSERQMLTESCPDYTALELNSLGGVITTFAVEI